MAITFVGDGTITSSVSITTVVPDLSNQYPALPEEQQRLGRDLTYMTEAGFFHAYMLAQPTRRFSIGCRLITTSQLEGLMNFYDTVTERHWFTWQLYTHTGSGGAVTHLDDSGYACDFSNQWRNHVIFLTSGTASPACRRITSQSKEVWGTQFNFTALSIAPSSDTVYTVGWPVRIVGGISRQAFGNNLYNADFTLEEVVLTDTV